MRNGFKVWDTDTHLHPSVETLEQYFDTSMKARLPELERFKVPGRTGGDFTPRDVAGRHQYRFPGQIAFKRILGHAEPPAVPVNNYGKFMGAVFPAAGTADDQIDTRISEMDRETDEPGATWMAPLNLQGMHNRRNALIARTVLRALAGAAGDEELSGQVADEERLAAAAADFTPLPSRLTPVGTVGGVTFIDDSLSTNVLPTLAALDSFPGKRVALIVGGQDRGIDYTALAEGVKRREEPTYVLTLPDSGPRITA